MRFEVSDDGVGFDARETSSNGGLTRVADTVGALGGEVEIEEPARTRNARSPGAFPSRYDQARVYRSAEVEDHGLHALVRGRLPRRPSFRKIEWITFSTERRQEQRRAIAALFLPSAISRSTSLSRGVSSSSGECSDLVLAATSASTTFGSISDPPRRRRGSRPRAGRRPRHAPSTDRRAGRCRPRAARAHSPARENWLRTTTPTSGMGLAEALGRLDPSSVPPGGMRMSVTTTSGSSARPPRAARRDRRKPRRPRVGPRLRAAGERPPGRGSGPPRARPESAPASTADPRRAATGLRDLTSIRLERQKGCEHEADSDMLGACDPGALLCAGCGGSSKNPPPTRTAAQADYYAIDQIEKTWHRAASTQNVDLMMTLWAPDATFNIATETLNAESADPEFFARRPRRSSPEPLGVGHAGLQDPDHGERRQGHPLLRVPLHRRQDGKGRRRSSGAIRTCRRSTGSG